MIQQNMLRRWRLPAAVLIGSMSAGAAFAADPFCKKIKEDLKGEVFVAKIPLYDTEVGPDQIYHLERDGEEIRKGQELTIASVDCGRRKIEMSLKPRPKGSKVDIYFFLSKDERQGAGAWETFSKMMTFVFEDPGASGGDP